MNLRDISSIIRGAFSKKLDDELEKNTQAKLNNYLALREANRSGNQAQAQQLASQGRQLYQQSEPLQASQKIRLAPTQAFAKVQQFNKNIGAEDASLKFTQPFFQYGDQANLALQTAASVPLQKMGVNFGPNQKLIDRVQSHGMLSQEGTIGKKELWNTARNTGNVALKLKGLLDPTSAARSMAGGAMIAPVFQVGKNLLDKKPIYTDVGKATVEGSITGFSNAGTTSLTNSLVEKLANYVPFLKPLTDKAIQSGLPQAGEPLKQALRQWGNTAGKRLIKAAILETIVETPIWAAINQDDREKYIDALSREAVENLVMNVGMASVNSLVDAKSLAPIVKNSINTAVDNWKNNKINPTENIRLQDTQATKGIDTPSSKISLETTIGQPPSNSPLQTPSSLEPDIESTQKKIQSKLEKTKTKSSKKIIPTVTESKIDPLLEEAKKYKSAEEFVKTKQKQEQLKIINKTNPMLDDYHTGIRSIKDIKTFEEAVNVPESFAYPDFDKNMADKAIKDGVITIYSSKPLDKAVGQFVSPSKRNALDYSGNGQVFSKTVDINDVAWIHSDEGQLVGNTQSKLIDIWNQSQVKPQTDNKTIKLTTPETDNHQQGSIKLTNEPYYDTKGEVQFPVDTDSREYQEWVKNAFTTPDVDISKSGAGRGSIMADSPETENLFKGWVNSRRATQVEGILKSRDFIDLDEKGIEGIFEFQAGDKSGKYADLKTYFDDTYQRVVDSGIKINYKQDYLPQLWKNPQAEVDAVFGNRLSLKPSFTLDSIIKNYKEGIEAGLTPRFTKISDLVVNYEARVNKAIADKLFFTQLKKDNLILPAGSAPRDWVTLDPDRFPRLSVSTDKGQYTGIYKAPDVLANKINNYLADPSTSPNDFLKGLNTIANWTSSVKNRVLSFGVPGTAINAHGFNILARNVMASINPIEGAITGIKYMLYPNSAAKYLDAELNKAPEAVKNGLTLSANEFKNVLEEPQGFRSKFGDVWNKLFEKGLFDRMLPALKLQKYQEVKAGFIKSGMEEGMAGKEAAKFINNVFGGINWEELGKSRDMQNVLRVTILAPDWLKTNINLAKNLPKSVIKLKDPTLAPYRRFLATFIGTYITMSVVNKLSSGHWMHENESGNTFNIEAGYTADGKKRYIRPFGTAADFIRIPYDVSNSLIQGDLQAPARVIRNRLSIPLGVGVGLLTDTDYTGQPIGYRGTDKYGKEILMEQRIAGVGGELATLAGMPAFMKQGFDYVGGKVGLEEALLQGMELPFRYSGGARNKTQRKISEILREQGATGKELYEANQSIKGLNFSDNDINKIKVGGLDEFNKQTKSKTTSAELKQNLKGDDYYKSKDAPKNLAEALITGGKALVTNPKQLLRAIFTHERIRKVENGFVVLERKQGLGQFDHEDKTTEIDHIIPLEFGGTNPTEKNETILSKTKEMSPTERNNYLKQHNLEVLSKDEHSIKTEYQAYLSKEVKNKNMTQKDAVNKIQNWREEVMKLPKNIMNDLVKDAFAADKTTTDSKDDKVVLDQDIYKVYEIVDEYTGKTTEIDLSKPIEEPKYTGFTEIDKKLKSNYKSAITKRINNITKLYEDGQLTAEQANKLISELKTKSDSVSSSRQGKSKRAITVKLSEPKKISITWKPMKRSLPTLKLAKAPTIKLAAPSRKYTIAA